MEHPRDGFKSIYIRKIKECNNYTCWLVIMLCKHSIVLRCMANYNIIPYLCHELVVYISCTCPRPLPDSVLDLSQTFPGLVLDLSWTPPWPLPGPLPDLSWTCLGPIPDLPQTCSYIILISWLSITPFQMLIFDQSPFSKVGLIIIKLPNAPLHPVLICSGSPIVITKLTLTSQQ